MSILLVSEAKNIAELREYVSGFRESEILLEMIDRAYAFGYEEGTSPPDCNNCVNKSCRSTERWLEGFRDWCIKNMYMYHIRGKVGGNND